MSDFLPTPKAQDAKHGTVTPSEEAFPERFLNLHMAVTSASSPASEGWISRWKRRGIPASDRSSGMTTAPESSSDGGRLFPVGEMSRSSRLLSTPTTMEDRPGKPFTTEHALTASGKRGGAAYLRDQVNALPHLTSSSGASLASPPPPLADGKEPPTIAGSGLRSPVSLANYDPELSSWRTSQASLLSTEDERFPRSSERWPTSGMTRRGRAFALPMSERATAGSGSSSLLGTPSAADAMGGHMTRGGDRSDELLLKGQVKDLLHTPTTGDTAPSYDHRASPGYTRAKPVPNLAAQVEDELLPTPNTLDGMKSTRPKEQRDADGRGGFANLREKIADLLPTPRTSDSHGAGKHGTGGNDFRSSLGELTPPPSEDGSE